MPETKPIDQASTVQIMGIVNLTPDSFSDGGRFYHPEAALEQCHRLADEGADLIDLGAESTRPGAGPLTIEEEWNRLAPVLEGLQSQGFSRPISIDTRNDATALRCLEFELVTHLNNVMGLYGTKVLEALGKRKSVQYICGHILGDPTTMQQNPLTAKNCLQAVSGFFQSATATLLDEGLRRESIYMDPGIGFGKDVSANLMLLKNIAPLRRDHRICIGVSRKSFIGRLLDIENPADRDAPSKMLELGLMISGVDIIRTHTIKPLVRMRELLSL